MAGNYSDQAGATFCHACPAPTYTYATGSDNATDCVCNTGYTGPGGHYIGDEPASDCTACPDGKYKDALGSAECTNCPAGEEKGGAARAR